MIDATVARRYASAMFSLGREEGGDAVVAHGKGLAALAAMLEESPALALTLKSPVVSGEEKKAVVGRLLDAIEAGRLLRNFCFLLADKGRLAFLGDIAACYGKLLDEERGVIRGRVTTAMALAPQRQAEIAASLGEKCGKSLELTFGVDKSIIGGMVFHMGDRVLDASLRAQLGILREIFKRGE